MEKEQLCSLSDTTIPKERACAFCKLKNVYLNANQLKKRKCLEKCCKNLENLRHPYWHQRMILRKRGEKI